MSDIGPMKICIVSHLAYGAISGGKDGHAGGVEHQTSLMARWLSSRGHQVSLLTWKESPAVEEKIDGVRVIGMCRRNEGWRGVRFFHPRWTSLNRCLRKAAADIYYHNCAEYVTGQVSFWCRSHGRRFIYSVASDAECERSSPATKSSRDRFLFRYGLRGADRIIVQTKKQQGMLRHHFGLSSVILPMPCVAPGTGHRDSASRHGEDTKRILWAGRIDREKRLELLLEIAEALPGVCFDVAGKPTNPEDPYVRRLLAKASSLPNVTLHGMVPRAKMAKLYGKAFLLCCTSLYEGFPNTFLEAWSHGLPVVSTYEPDDLLRERGLGLLAMNSTEMISSIRTLIESPGQWQKMSDRAIGYYEGNHSLDQSMLRFEALFSETGGLMP